MQKNEKDTRPIMVSIRCLVYNHEPYLRDCLNGFVMQKTNFRFEAIVHDDASTDGSAAIIREYAEKYPEIIKPIYETENQYSKHDGSLRRIMDAACIGKYIAICEGDDYWTDSYKLQKQFEILENDNTISFCCHRYNYLIEKTGAHSIFYNKYFDEENKEVASFRFSRDYPFVSRNWVTKTLTCMYRANALDNSFLKKFEYSRDVHMVYSILTHGDGICLADVMGTYRINEQSTFGGKSKLNRTKQNYLVYSELYEVTKDSIFIPIMRRYYQSILKHSFFSAFPPRNVLEIKALALLPFDIVKQVLRCCTK